jgi:KDO2-lipid IV(A) lauroyltransferase
MPELTSQQRAEILRRMWEQLGRTIGEFPHLGRASFRSRVRLENATLLAALKKEGRRLIFLAGHLSNWEVCPLAASLEGMPITLTYRQTNNPYVNFLVEHTRQRYMAAGHRKGRGGMRHIVRALRKGDPVAMMVDQKENGGIPVPFFHAPAMTTPLPVQLAHKLDALLILVRARRTPEGHYQIDLLPLPLPSGMTESGVVPIVEHINRQFEEWIRERPEDWFWLHRRWPKES